MQNDSIDAVAADWFARLLSADCTESERERFEQWCAANERHADAFAAVAQSYDDAAVLKDDELVRAAARAARHSTPARFVGAGRGRLAKFAAAAVLVLAVAGTSFWMIRDDRVQAVRYATVVGEQRSVDLPDGTRVQLDTDTDFTTRFGNRGRELVLDHGRIQVDVANDAQRGFVVLSGRGVIRDVGTRFQVASYDGDVTVTLLSGIVSVALAKSADGEGASTLAPGQQLHYGLQGGLGQPTRVDLAVASGWTSGTLIFKDRRLGDLLDEMNRYSAIKIHLADPSLAQLAVSGVFRAGDQTSLLQALQVGWSIRSRHLSADEILLSAAH